MRAGLSAELPSCRAYEQVSPVDKAGYNAIARRSQALSNHGFGYASGPSQAFAGSSNSRVNDYVGLRSGTDWFTQMLLPPSTFAAVSSFNGVPNLVQFSEDGSKMLVLSVDNWDPDDHNTGSSNFDLYRIGSAGEKTWMSRGTGNAAQINNIGGSMIATPDLSKVVFGAKESLDPSHPVPLLPSGAGYNIYVSDGGTPRLASILPGGGTDPGGASLGGVGISDTGLGTISSPETTVSPNAEMVVFRSFDSADGISVAQLYVRNLARETTTLISKGPGPSGEPADHGVTFDGAAWGASPGEGTVYFSTRSDLLGGHPEGGLYQYDIANAKVSYIAPAVYGMNDCTAPLIVNANCSGVIAIADDGSHVYFASSKVLAPATPGSYTDPVEGRANLYVYDSGSREIRFIATLARSLSPQLLLSDIETVFGGEIGPQEGSISRAAVGVSMASHQAQASPGDGRILVFASRSKLTSFENEDHGEIYRYDSDSEQMTCVSCGTTPVTGGSWLSVPNDVVREGTNAISYFGATVSAVSPSRQGNFVSPGGRSIFFNSAQGVVPGDTNGVVDPYVWTESGDSGHGTIALLGTGKANTPSYFVESSTDGNDAFINTPDRLVAQDRDTLYDIYDVREDGGLASQQSRPSPNCGGEACQGEGMVAPAAPQAASQQLNGPGNAKPRRARAAKPKRHRHGRRPSGHAKKHRGGKHTSGKRGAK